MHCQTIFCVCVWLRFLQAHIYHFSIEWKTKFDESSGFCLSQNGLRFTRGAENWDRWVRYHQKQTFKFTKFTIQLDCGTTGQSTIQSMFERFRCANMQTHTHINAHPGFVLFSIPSSAPPMHNNEANHIDESHRFPLETKQHNIVCTMQFTSLQYCTAWGKHSLIAMWIRLIV